MKKNLQMIALGFLISALVLFVFSQVSPSVSKSVKQPTSTKAEQTKATSKNEASWKEKYEKLLAEKELEKTKQAEQKAKEEEAKKKVKTYTLTLEKGDPSSKASEELQKNGIIKNANDFDNYLKQNNYEKYIRDGKYPLNSDMSFEQIAKKLAHK
ncbi:endolytic transglycosylase MltG [Listeria sp. PSOL-1]|uniref:endolytic transglycosylase MltG n=1 Tax=Listeria sp. PSOL-1 TaxID=1844999 RepID=UPI0013CF9D22|nr:endolytic transglycosylase MltG [Listeria sp. PSOL-1]